MTLAPVNGNGEGAGPCGREMGREGEGGTAREK